MGGSLSSIEALLEDENMEIFFNNGKAFRESLKAHQSSNTQKLHQLYYANSSIPVKCKLWI